MRKSPFSKLFPMLGAALVVLLLVPRGGWPAASPKADYPRKAIDLVVSFAPGAGADLLGRVMAEALSKKWAVPVNVVNKPGGATVVATNEVMRSAPDGYTILVDGIGSSSMQVYEKDLPYKVEQRTFIARAAASPMAFFVPYTSPWRTLKDVAEAARKDPAILTWTSAGGTSTMDLAQRQFLVAAGIDVPKTKMVAFSGGGPASNAVAGGHVQLSAVSASTIISLVQAKRVRCVAVTSPERLKDYPDTPTTVEQGFPSVNITFWIGFSGPVGLPPNVVKAWTDAVSAVLKDRDVIAKLDGQTSVPAFLGPEAFKKFVFEEANLIRALTSGKAR